MGGNVGSAGYPRKMGADGARASPSPPYLEIGGWCVACVRLRTSTRERPVPIRRTANPTGMEP